MQIILFSLGIILFIGLVIIHEWGHFFAARRNGVEVEEFGLGFPPRAWGKKLKSGLLLSLNWVPMGGFVKLKGEYDSDERPGSLGVASLYAKTKIMLAGVAMNLVVGLVLLTILALIGTPKLITKDSVGQDQFTVASNTKVTSQQVMVGQILPGSPADKSGLRGTDVVVSVASGGHTYETKTTAQLHQATEDLAGQTIALTYKRNSNLFTKQIQLLSKKTVQDSQKTNNPKGYLGVVPIDLQVQRSTWSAPIVALGLTKQLLQLTLVGLGHAFAGLGSLIAGAVTGNHTARVNGGEQAANQVGGPVAIGMALWGFGSLGFNFMLFLIAIISLTLALINVLPLPALDGGRLAMMLISRGVFKKPLSRSAEEKIVGYSMALIIFLAVVITIVDVKRFS